MSNTIDNRVLEMRFDNKQFEKNVSTTMSTLDKLKEKLKFKGAEKGLENIDQYSKNMKFNGLQSGIQAVSAKFSAMQIVGITALTNITNQAINTGKRMVKALTLDPVTTGFKEYETKMNSIQTIMSNTASKGTTMADVTKVIDELNTYADKTIYNFAEMTRNIGTFTAAGVGLEESASAIKGIANLAAASGSTSQQASTAMYQLSQALAAGTVKLQDWNSVVNAGMGGEKFQNALKQTAREMGIAVDAAIEKTGSFRESMREGWMTADVLSTTLKKFTVEGAKEYAASMNMSAEATKKLVDEAMSMEDAATKVKTFTQLWDTMKEAAQSGWGKTWELIIGDFEKAKDRLSHISDIMNGFIDKMSDARNNFLESGLSSGFDVINRKLNTLGITTDKFEAKVKQLSKVSDKEWSEMTKDCKNFEDALKKLLSTGTIKKSTISEAIKSLIGDLTGATKSTEAMAKSVEEYGEIVERVISGEFGNGRARIEALTAAGYDYYKVQNMVNEKLGDSFRYEVQHTEAMTDAIDATAQLTEEQLKNADSLAKKADADLEALGYTKEQIEALRFLSSEATQAGKSIDDLVDSISRPSGAELIWKSIDNILESISEKFKIVEEAWHNVFGEADGEDLYKVIARIELFTQELTFSEEQTRKFKNTVEGVFAGISIANSLFTMSLTSGLKILAAVLDVFGMSLLDVGDLIANYIKQLHAWLNEHTLLIGTIDKLAAIISEVIRGVDKLARAFLKLKPVQDIFVAIGDGIAKIIGSTTGHFDGVGIEGVVQRIIDIFTELEAIVTKLGDNEYFQAGVNIIIGLVNGISSGIDMVVSTIINLASSLITAFCDMLHIQSPSRVFYDFGVWIVQGLVNGIVHMINLVIETISTLANVITDGIGNINWDILPDSFKKGLDKTKSFLEDFDFKKLLAVIPVGAALLVVKKIYDVASVLADGISKFNSVLSGMSGVLSGLGDIEKAFATKIKAKAMKDIALSLAVVIGAFSLLVYVYDEEKMIGAVGVVTSLAALLLALSVAMKKISSASIEFSKESKGFKMEGLIAGLISLSASLLMMSAAVKLLGGMNIADSIQGFIGVGILVGAMAGVFAAYGKLVKGKAAANIDKAGVMMRKMATSLLIMALTCKLIGLLSISDIAKGAAFMTAFAGFTAAMMAVTSGPAGRHAEKAGKMLRSISVSMILMIGVCKLAGMLNVSDMIKGAGFAAAFVIFVKYLLKVTRVGKDTEFAKLGLMLMSISTAMLSMVGLCKLVSLLSAGDIAKGIAFVTAFTIFIKILVQITTIGPEEQIAKVSLTLMAVSVAIGILAGVCVLLSLLTPAQILKGAGAITAFGLVLAAMIAATKGASQVKAEIMALAGTVVAMTVALSILATIPMEKLATAALSLVGVMAAFALVMSQCRALGTVKMGTIVSLTLTLAGLTGVLALVSNLKPEGMMQKVGAISILLTAITGVFHLLKNVKINPKEMGTAIITLSSVILPMVGIVGVLQLLQGTETATQNVIALVGLMTAMTFLTNSMKPMNPSDLVGALSKVLLISALIVPMGLFALQLREMSGVENAIKNATALSILMGVTTAVVAALSVIGNNWVGMLSGIGGLSLMIIPMAIFVNTLKSMEGMDHAMENAKAISLLIGTFGAVLTVLSLVGPLALVAVGAINALVISVTAFGVLATAIGALMENVPTLRNFLDTGLEVLIGLGEGLGRMAAAFITAFGESLGDTMVHLGAQISMFVSWIHAASVHAAAVKGESFQGVKEAIKLMGDIAGVTLETGLADLFTFGGTSMEKFRDDMIVFVEAMKEICSHSTGFAFDQGGFDAIIDSAEALVRLQKKINPSGGVFELFTGFTNLGSFADDGVLFIKNIKMVLAECTGFTFNKDGFDIIMKASNELAKLQSKIEPIEGLAQAFTGFTDLKTFGSNVAHFIESMKTALSACTGFVFNKPTFDMIINAATSLATLQGSLEPMGGVISWFTGRSDLGKFGANISSFMWNIREAFTGLSGFKVDPEVINTIVTCATKLSELQNGLEPMGGVISWFKGKDDLGEFGVNIHTFITQLQTAFKGIDENFTVNTEVIDQFIAIAQKLIELQKALPEEGMFDGKIDLSEYSSHINNFASAMAGFNTKIDGMNVENMDAAIKCANDIRTLIESLKGIDTSGLEIFTGIGTGGLGADGSVSDIADTIVNFGDKLENVNVENIDKGVTCMTRLRSFITSLIGIDTTGISTFITSVQPIGQSISDFSSKVAGVDVGKSISAISAIRSLVTEIGNMAGLDTSGVAAFKAAMDELSTIKIGEIVKTFESASGQLLRVGSNLITSLASGMKSKGGELLTVTNAHVRTLTTAYSSKLPMFKKIGVNIMTQLISGLKSMSISLNTAATSMVSSACSAVRGKYADFTIAGRFLGQGLILGIEAKIDGAYDAGYRLGQAAVQGEKDGQASASPSKLTIKAGKWLGEGLVIGIGKMTKNVYKAGYGMGETAIASISGAIEHLSDMVDSDMDITPTITPVMDLNDVKTGIRAIDSMMGYYNGVGLANNMNQLNKVMSRSNQNGTANDIVTAINKLRKEMGEVGGTTYNVNGITYDDGSNITDAVKTLVRAARVERRI